jgi:hypothetical protein
MPTFVIVPGAWDTPAVMDPLVGPLKSAGHAVIVVDLPCADARATLEDYAAAVRAALPERMDDVVRAMAARAAADVVEIDTGHGPYREQPTRLAQLLVATTTW